MGENKMEDELSQVRRQRQEKIAKLRELGIDLYAYNYSQDHTATEVKSLFNKMEAEAEDRLVKLAGYQINGELMRLAKPNALVMHCLPAYRGKEIDEETFETHAATIFTQAENRLHTQKAILTWLAS